MKHTPLTILSILALALVGCGSTETTSDEPQNAEEAQQEYADELEQQGAMEQEPEAQTAGHGTYRVHATSGTELEFQLPADTSHEAVTEIDALREELGIEPVTYITADIDNRQGDTLAALPQINVYDADGTEYEFKSLPYSLPEWEPEYDDSDHYWDTYDRLKELEDQYDDAASPAGVGSTVLIYQGDNLPTQFTRVATYPNGAGQADDAYLVE